MIDSLKITQIQAEGRLSKLECIGMAKQLGLGDFG